MMKYQLQWLCNMEPISQYYFWIVFRERDYQLLSFCQCINILTVYNYPKPEKA